MPFTSDQIAMMNAQYQGQHMGNMQQAGMFGGGGQGFADNFAGGAINRAGAMGGPLAMGGMAVMGLDPISMGLRAGMGASRMGMGFMGAGTVGLGAAGIAGAGMMAAGYAGNQIFTGAQQQQTFNASMNSTFRFANQHGGQGFGRGGLGEIGGMMRGMTTEQGSMGQMVGFEELGRLAANMGRMGMTQGVRDAKEFSTKFREMIKSVKEIAENMGTSLEEAQKMMSSMRGAGVFGAHNAANASSRIRTGAMAGGMATSEMTGMMQVGSQISRAIGGRGRAGAMGGLETITNIGVAQQMGIMNEEDVYNVTGLTGAEGRRAMATRQMEQSAQWLRGGQGRRFLASVAGKGGQLDESSIEEYLAGGVGTDRTMSMAGKNLSKVGRADFIRNEGKLRGAALERLGGLAPMIAMKGWLDERGINPSENSDRAMIFMQRQLGMGNDEAEMMLRQVRDLPQILRQRSISGQDDEYTRRLAERRSNTGIEGIKKKFESARAGVQAALQQVGASFYESMSESVDQFVNHLTDTYVKDTRKDVSSAFRSAMGGGAIGAQTARTTFGVGSGNLGSMFGGANPLSGGGISDMATFQKSDAERFSRAGFAFSGGDLTSHISSVSQIANAFQGGDAGLAGREGIQSLGQQGKEALRNDLISQTGMVRGKGLERLKGFGRFLQSQSGKGNHGLNELAQRYANAGNDIERAQIMAAYTGEGGAGFAQGANFLDPGLRGIFGTSKFATQGEGDEAVGNAFVGFDPLAAAESAARNGAFVTGPGGMTFSSPAQTSAPGAKAIGSFLRSEGGRSTIDSLLRGDQKTRDATFQKVSEEIMKLQDKDKLTGDEGARLQGMRGMVMARTLNEMRINGASKEQLEAEAQRLAKENGIPIDQVRSQVDTVLSVAENNRLGAVAQAGERGGEEARANIAALQRGGLVTGSGSNLTLNASVLSKMKGGKASEAFLGAMLEKQQALASIGPGMDPKEVDRLFQKGINAGQNMGNLLAGMSVSEQRKLAEGLRGIEGTEEVRGEIDRKAAMGGMIEKGAKRGPHGGLSAAAGIMGATLSPGEIAKLMKEGGPAAVAKAIAGGLGGGISEDAALMGTLTKGLEGIHGGKTGVGTQAIDQFMGDETVRKARVDKGDPDKNLEKISEYAKTSAEKSTLMAESLASISNQMKSNAEDWNPFH